VEYLKQINKEVNPHIDIFNDEQMSKLDFAVKSKLIVAIKFKAIFKMNLLNETEKRKLSRPFEEISLGGNANDFSWYFDPWYGNCWMFNSGFNRTGHKEPLVTVNVPRGDLWTRNEIICKFLSKSNQNKLTHWWFGRINSNRQ
jgi:hypothetical protein